jgi:hypothetical protein
MLSWKALELTDLDDVNPSFNSPLGTSHIRLNNLLDILFRSLFRLREVLAELYSTRSPDVVRPSPTSSVAVLAPLSHGAMVDAFRPAWASWTPTFWFCE